MSTKSRGRSSILTRMLSGSKQPSMRSQITVKVDDSGNMIRQKSARKSPYSKSEVDMLNEIKEENSALGFMTNKLDLFFETSLPEIIKDSVSNLPRSYLYGFGLFAQAVALLSFVLFVYLSYNQEITSSFISLDDSTGRCGNVVKSVTGTFVGSDDGYWTGSSNYMLAKGIYKFEFYNLATLSTEFEELMNEYSSDLSHIGSIALNQTLPENLLYWATYKKSITVDGNDQKLSFAGSPAAIFNTDKFLIAMGSSDYRNCSITDSTYWQPTHRYYTYNGKVEIQWAVSDYEQTPCYYISTPEQFGYDSSYDGDKLSMLLDFNSYSVVVATNLGILGSENLSPSFDDTYLYYRGVNYTFNLYFDDRFVLMDRIYCMTNYSGTDTTSSNPFTSFCFLSFGKYLAIPVLNSWGYFSSDIERCACPIDADSYCNNLDLLVTLIYFPTESNEDTSWTVDEIAGTKILDLALKYTASELSRLAWNASNALTLRDDEYVQSDHFDFCDNECAVFMVNTYSLNQKPLVTPYYYQLNTGSCSDTFTSSNFSQLVNTPPTELVETYLKCYAYRNYAFLNSVGVAAGSVQSAMPIMLMVIMPIVYMFLKYNGLLIFLEERYPPLEKEQALKELAEYILMIRDGKKTPFKKTGLVYRITEELITAARQSVLDEDELVKDLTLDPSKIPGNENRRRSIFALNRTFSMMRRRSGSAPALSRQPTREDSNYSSAEEDDGDSSEDDDDDDDDEEEDSNGRQNGSARGSRRPFSDADEEDDDDDNNIRLRSNSPGKRRSYTGGVSINIDEESKIQFVELEGPRRGGLKQRSPPKPPKPFNDSSYAEI